MAVKRTVLFLLILLLPIVLEARDPAKPKADGMLGLKEEMRQKIKTIKSLLDEVSALAEICGACDSNPCLNGGTCLEEAGGKYSCQCAIGWKGDRCDVCHKTIGMEDGTISDGQITASSNEAEHEASRGRLNFEVAPGKPGSWSARVKDSNQWLQVDLGTRHRNISGVATQGGTNYREKSRWVTKYKLKFSDDGVNFQYYKREGQATDEEFVGNKDLKTVVYHDLNPPVSARYLRIEPTAWKLWISMRAEFYGCEEIKACDSSPCLNNGTCIDKPGGNYSCQCQSGWKGDQCEGLDAMGLEDSDIIGKNAEQLNSLGEWLKSVTPSDRHWKLCSRASENGWGATTFHSLCDGKGPTVSIIKVDKYIFGGYTSTSWTTSCGYKSDSKAFLFSLVNKAGWAPVRLPQTGQHASSNSYSIYSCSSYGPTFGGGHDLYIADLASSNTNSYTNLGHSYSPPNGHSYSSPFAKSFLAGNYNFQPDEVETFYEST